MNIVKREAMAIGWGKNITAQESSVLKKKEFPMPYNTYNNIFYGTLCDAKNMNYLT